MYFFTGRQLSEYEKNRGWAKCNRHRKFCARNSFPEKLYEKQVALKIMNEIFILKIK